MDKPILFSTPMVQAILDGRKSMTRRVCKDIPDHDFHWGLDRTPYKGDYKLFTKIEPRKWGWVTLENQWLYDLQTAVDESKTYLLKCPYGQPGDRLWVRETTWISECKRYVAQGLEKGNSELDVVDIETGNRYIHQIVGEGDHAVADGMITSWSRRGRYLRSGREIEGFDISFADVDTAVKAILFSGNIILKKHEAQFRKKLPSIYMPKSIARIWLEVEDVRVERLQNITEADAIAEGIEKGQLYYYGEPHAIKGSPKCYNTAKEAFKGLWDSLNAKRGYGWDTNPWVWVISFKRLEVKP